VAISVAGGAAAGGGSGGGGSGGGSSGGGDAVVAERVEQMGGQITAINGQIAQMLSLLNEMSSRHQGARQTSESDHGAAK